VVKFAQRAGPWFQLEPGHRSFGWQAQVVHPANGVGYVRRHSRQAISIDRAALAANWLTTSVMYSAVEIDRVAGHQLVLTAGMTDMSPGVYVG
jgi:hypothetical protein